MTSLRVVEQTDARGLPQQLAYDKNGNIIRDRDADGAFWSYFYKSWNLVDEARAIQMALQQSMTITCVKPSLGLSMLVGHPQNMSTIIVTASFQ